MKNYFKQLLAKDLEKILSIKQAEIYKFLEYPKDETMADLALPCFASAKANGVKPQDCANAVVEVFKSKNFTASAVGGFVNFKINPAAFDTFLQSVLDDKNLTIQKEKKKTIIMDAGGANVAKELHMGHLRSPIIGEALKRLYRVFGHKVISDVHLGDWGLQMGLTILQIEIEKKSLKNIKEEEITLDFLNEVYPKASAKAKVDEAFRKKAEDYTVRIQKKQEPYYEAYRIIHRASLKDIRKNYDNLFVEFELWLGESDAEAYTDYIIDYLIKKGVTKEENGTLIVEVKKEGEHILKPKTNPTDKDEYLNPMPPLILKKANEGVLYATTDLATIYQRIKDYKPDEMIYVVDERQRMHFEQVF
ncbi:MAG: arginine--tRNA ligase, partial [Firmicutes bacterium]|nr:arginine--tRNA ligase [Bacillota bacterium]